jgi:YegS/Rv2252/BmrU family lipid kinase
MARKDTGQMMARAVLIVNPHAGQKAGFATNEQGPRETLAALQRQGVDVELCLTEGPGHATELAGEARKAGRELVIAAGGDGTVHEVACALIGGETALGVMPLGSMMNIARSLHIPRELDGAAAVIKAGHVVQMDVGQATTRTAQDYFLEAAGVGIDAAIARYANRLDAGDWTALLPMIGTAARFVPRRTRLVVDGQVSEVRPFMITVAITPFSAAAMAFAPDAKVDDRQFDVVVRDGFSRLELTRHMLSITRGHRAWHPKARTLRGRQVEVGPGSRRLLVHADGNSLGLAPARFEILPGALAILAPERRPSD